jgi:hypothetical protein
LLLDDLPPAAPTASQQQRAPREVPPPPLVDADSDADVRVARRAARAMHARGVALVAVTLGARGALISVTEDPVRHRYLTLGKTPSCASPKAFLCGNGLGSTAHCNKPFFS